MCVRAIPEAAGEERTFSCQTHRTLSVSAKHTDGTKHRHHAASAVNGTFFCEGCVTCVTTPYTVAWLYAAAVSNGSTIQETR